MILMNLKEHASQSFFIGKSILNFYCFQINMGYLKAF